MTEHLEKLIDDAHAKIERALSSIDSLDSGEEAFAKLGPVGSNEAKALAASLYLVGLNRALHGLLVVELKAQHGRIPQLEAHALADAWSRNMSCTRLFEELIAVHGPHEDSVALLWPVALQCFLELTRISTGTPLQRRMIDHAHALIASAKQEGGVIRAQVAFRAKLAAA